MCKHLAACGLGFSIGLGCAGAALADTGCNARTWTEVPGAGITNGTAPAAAALGSNLHLFVVGGSDLVYTNVYQSASGAWSGWSVVPGGLGVRGMGSGIYQNLRGPGSTDSWSELPGAGSAAATAGPAIVVYQNAFRFFVTGPGDRVICSAR